MDIRIAFDGACNNHLEDPPAGVGVAVFFDEVYQKKLSFGVPIHPGELTIRNTNNTTEWQACIYAMSQVRELSKNYPDAKFIIWSDSQVVTQVFNGRHQTHTEHFKQYNIEAHEALGKDIVVTIIWVKRNFNKEADVLSKIGIKLATNETEQSTKSLSSNN
jgi:ribonuclease HI